METVTFQTFLAVRMYMAARARERASARALFGQQTCTRNGMVNKTFYYKTPKIGLNVQDTVTVISVNLR